MAKKKKKDKDKTTCKVIKKLTQPKEEENTYFMIGFEQFNYFKESF